MDFRDYIDDQVFHDAETYANSGLENFILDMFLDTECNLRCRHCYFGGDYQRCGDALKVQEWIEIMNSFRSKGCTHFHISGRESLLYDGIDKVIRHLDCMKREGPIYCGLITNGTSRDIPFYNSVLDVVDYLEFSVDGLRQNHDYMRGTGTFEKVSRTIAVLEYKDKMNITFSVYRDNKSDLLDLISLFSRYGITKFYCSPIQSVGNARSNRLDLIDADEYVDLIRQSIVFLSESNVNNIDLKFSLTRPYVEYILEHDIFPNKIAEYFSSMEPICWNCRSNIVELSLQLFSIPFYSQVSITDDGYLLPTAETVGRNEIQPQRYTDIDAFMELRKQSILHFLKR